MGHVQHVEHIDYLWHEFIPKLQLEVTVGSCQRGNECECLDGMLRSADTMIVQFNQLEFALFFVKAMFDVLGHLIVHHIQLCLVTFRVNLTKLSLYALKMLT